MLTKSDIAGGISKFVSYFVSFYFCQNRRFYLF